VNLRFLTVAFALASLTACRIDFDGDGDGHFQENFHMNFKVEPGARLSLDNENGSVEIVSWERNEVEVNGTKFASSESLLRDVKVDANATPGLVTIRTLRQRVIHGGNSGARFAIRAPKHMILDRIHSTNGPISVESIAAPVTVESTNGALHLTRVEGKIEGHTTNGSIELTSCTGDVRLNSTNGRIEGEVEGGMVDARTSNGSINMRIGKLEGKGPLRMSTSNGSIDVTLDAGHEMRASTTNSSITLHLPSNVSAELHARTSHAKVSSEFEVSQISGNEEDRKSLDARLGAGGPLIDLSTSNGSIHIVKR
jgi:DUF4097 and DUF4098 domain-containing protein YvlB